MNWPAIEGSIAVLCSSLWLATAIYWCWDAWTGRRAKRAMERKLNSTTTN